MDEARPFEFSHTPIDAAKYAGPYDRGRAEIIEASIRDGRGRSAIDLGCGSGYFSQVLARRGWAVTAVDTDPANVEAARSFAREARVGDAIGVLSQLPASGFDLALALEIIEHMPKSYGERLLAGIRGVLRPGGMLLLSTPNRYSLEGLSGYYWGEKIRRWGKWNAWDVTHVHIYDSTEIVRLLERSGFRIERVTGYWYEGRLPGIGHWRLPLRSSKVFPLNRLGFNIIVECVSA